MRIIESRPFGKRGFQIEGTYRFGDTWVAQIRLQNLQRLPANG